MANVENAEIHPSRAKQAAEKSLRATNNQQEVLRGLKPDVDFIMFICIRRGGRRGWGTQLHSPWVGNGGGELKRSRSASVSAIERFEG
jgi:hypothetical protein